MGMESVIICICIVAVIVMLGLLAVVIFVTMYCKPGSKDEISQPVETVYGSQTSFGRVWQIQLWNVFTNQVYQKEFSSQVMVGRSIPGSELFWQMCVGSNITISRRQCVIYDRGGFLVVENMSKTNPTKVNGIEIATPVMFQKGSQLTMGEDMFFVSDIRRIA